MSLSQGSMWEKTLEFLEQNYFHIQNNHFENIFIMVNILYLLVLSVNGFNLPKLSFPKIEFKPLFPTK